MENIIVEFPVFDTFFFVRDLSVSFLLILSLLVHIIKFRNMQLLAFGIGRFAGNLNSSFFGVVIEIFLNSIKAEQVHSFNKSEVLIFKVLQIDRLETRSNNFFFKGFSEIGKEDRLQFFFG